MPHLTTPGDAPPAGAAGGRTGRLTLGVPGCAHPMLAPMEWGELSRSGLGARPGPGGRAGPLRWAVLDVAGGPGSRPDPYCAPAATALRASGVALLGHLDMRDGARTSGDLLAEAHRFLEWYRVDGFYLARCPSGAERVQETHRVVAALRTLCDSGHIVLGHGSRAAHGPYGAPSSYGAHGPYGALGEHPHEGYAECADQLVTFSGSWAEYRWSQAAEWTAGHPPGRFCHLVHSLPRTHLKEALRIARWQGVGTVCFTDRTTARGQDPWDALPGYWDEIVSRVGPGVSE